jgi:YfiH family protein
VEWLERDRLRWLEAELPGARAAFSTRLGGVSQPPYAALNIGILTGDDLDHVRTNRQRLASSMGRDPNGVVMARQAHGTELRRHEAPQAPRVFADAVRSPDEADAQATANADLTPLVLVADCLPVALVGPGGVAMAHCGWRGLAGGIVSKAAAAVQAEAAAIGPGIGPCCYEIGDEVRAAFRNRGHDSAVLADGHLDIALAVRHDLERAGVPEDRIVASGICTSCNPELFFSHRRDGGVTGRQAGLVWLDS